MNMTMTASHRSFLLTVVAALAACVASFCVSYAMNDQPAVRRAAREGDAMNWLRAEFQLTPSQFEAIKKLHENYNSVCAAHCVAINEAKARAASAEEIAQLEKTCVDSMTDHFRRVAALMPRGEGERYLAMVLPRVSHYEHKAGPTLRGTP
ncbi:MAG TPA: hypothetical protein VFT72_07810 [Opitutaceae bacterium]|nr:hypothetical protein [Opitutaceae bacterium]